MNFCSFTAISWSVTTNMFKPLALLIFAFSLARTMPRPVIAPADLHTVVVQLHGNGKQKKKTLAKTLKLKVCYRVNNIPPSSHFHIDLTVSRLLSLSLLGTL